MDRSGEFDAVTRRAPLVRERAGVVDEHVKAILSGEEFLARLSDPGEVTHVHDDGVDASLRPVEFADKAIQLLGIAGEQHEVRAEVGKEVRGSQSETGGRAGDRDTGRRRAALHDGAGGGGGWRDAGAAVLRSAAGVDGGREAGADRARRVPIIGAWMTIPNSRRGADEGCDSEKVSRVAESVSQ